MTFKKDVNKLYKVISEHKILNWTDDYSGDDLSDAIDHINLMRNRNFDKGISDADFLRIEDVDPKRLLPVSAFKGKAFGWLKKSQPKHKWAEEFNKYLNRKLDHLFEQEELDCPIVIDGELGDGYGRVHLAYALEETLPVAVFKGEK